MPIFAKFSQNICPWCSRGAFACRRWKRGWFLSFFRWTGFFRQRIAGEGGGKEACSQWWLGNDYELIKFTQTALSQLSRQQIEKGAQWKTSIVPTYLTAPVTRKQQQLEVLKAAWYDRKGSRFELQLLHFLNAYSHLL